MFYMFLLAFFLVEFLVIIGVITFAILFSRPEVPLKGDGWLDRIVIGDDDERSLQRLEAEPTARRTVAARDSHTPMSQLRGVLPAAFVALSVPSVGGLRQIAAQRPSWLANN